MTMAKVLLVGGAIGIGALVYWWNKEMTRLHSSGPLPNAAERAALIRRRAESERVQAEILARRNAPKDVPAVLDGWD